MHGRDLRARGVASVDEYIDLLITPQKDVAAQLRAIIRTHYPLLHEDIKWHVPVYSLGTTPIVSIEAFKAHVNLNFFKGAASGSRGPPRGHRQRGATYQVPLAGGRGRGEDPGPHRRGTRADDSDPIGKED